MKIPITSFLIIILWISCCSCDEKTGRQDQATGQPEMQETNEGLASITEVSVSGEENQFSFSVTISSPDLGCQQYADWWEVVDLDGNLLYRRILTHSHVDEQPFTRIGGPVPIDANIEVYVRAHMNTTAYGNNVFKGTIADGFSATTLDSEFAIELAEADPLPNGCAF